jgi:hypothetical protein
LEAYKILKRGKRGVKKGEVEEGEIGSTKNWAFKKVGGC